MIPERLLPLLEETAPLAGRFAAAGWKLYLVGGSVRDAILGRAVDQSGDLDFTTDARPDDIEAVTSGWADALWDQGRRFGTIGVRKGDRTYEITTHRAEVYTPDSRKPDVAFADVVEADLSRRDFTVNAMALELTAAPGGHGRASAELVDPFGGVADLASSRLRTPLSPEESFSDDPLRMMRAARFVTGYGLVPDPDLVAAVKSLRGRLEIVSAERIRAELDKLLVTEKPGDGLWFLVETGLAEEFMPELPALALQQDPVHRHKDVLAHTIAVVEKTRPDRILRLAALLHDIGKPKTRSFGKGGVSFHHHEVVGARMAEERMRALRYPEAEIADVRRLVELHLRFHGYGDDLWTDAAVRRYATDAGPLLEKLNELTRCDCTTRNQRKAADLSRRMDLLEERIAQLREQEELDRIRPDLDGNQIMEHLGIGPGRDVGLAWKFLYELRLEEGPLGEEEARRRLDLWWVETHPPS
ncbi:MAG: CCA tRNA nucleotidyltransferase [Actinomycetota bacterium]|nr:CCA tRNA nucleotidyltransferase [Actinomycetota bacterium]